MCTVAFKLHLLSKHYIDSVTLVLSFLSGYSLVFIKIYNTSSVFYIKTQNVCFLFHAGYRAYSEICSCAGKHLGTYVDITAYTPGDITQPGDKLGNSSGAPEGLKWENQEIMLFSQYLFQMCHKCTSRNDRKLVSGLMKAPV